MSPPPIAILRLIVRLILRLFARFLRPRSRPSSPTAILLLSWALLCAAAGTGLQAPPSVPSAGAAGRDPRAGTGDPVTRVISARHSPRLPGAFDPAPVHPPTRTMLSGGVTEAPPPAASDRVPDGLWVPPFGLPLRITEPFRPPEHRYGPGHRGIDIAAGEGEAVASPVTGVVSFAGDVAARPVVTVRSPDGALFSLEPVGDAPPVGTEVVAGDRIGAVGTGGHCSGGCVHLGVRVNGEYVDPMLRYLGRPRLLPW
ncbi:peptidoglycan DD-metalloendopeptidase family protein [Leucobacter sp. CSA2]|uniref:Peptidoglycan DD-metalloendopeptidase family protein n=1 Tax=Leucobacter edaphi TaxID=2796472 RepID=A0A934QD68_9MICO|nr:M23 family metallopeptidase [Leucobacter edaphi]MBK0421029.1 peptidoglycan DD-metalloendopeptidase family protein [Leucobacter edaphi]